MHSRQPAGATWPHDPRCAHELRGYLLAQAGQPAEPSTRLRHQIAVRIGRHCGHGPLRSHRLAWGWSIREAVAAVHELCRAGGHTCALAERLWEKWERGAHVGPYYQDLLARLFRTRPDRLGLSADYTDYAESDHASADRAESDRAETDRAETDRVEVRGVGSGTPAQPVSQDSGPPLPERTFPMSPDEEAHKASAGAGSPHRAGRTDQGTESEIIMTARESAHFTSNLSNIGPADIDLLRDEVASVAGLFANAPRHAVFARTRMLRDHTFGLLDRRLAAAEFRDLYFLAGAICGMLAEITQNLGYQAEAMAHARTAWLCADQAGHDGLKAWILAEQSVIAYSDGRPGVAASYARSGQQYQTKDSVRAELPALESRATAIQGDVEGTRAALARVAEARERVEPAELDNLGGILGCILPKQQFYTAEANLWIGAGVAAVAEAEACITGYQNGPEQVRARDNEASAQLNLALAHADSGDLDAVQNAAQPAFAIAPELRTCNLAQRFRRLHQRMTAPDVRESPVAVSLRDQVEDFLAGPTPALPTA